MSRILASLAIAVALVVGLYAFLHDGSGGGQEAREGGAAAPGVSEIDESGEDERPDIPAPLDPEPGSAQGAEDPPQVVEPERTAVEVDPNLVVGVQPEDGMLVRIVVAGSGEPAPGARVRYVEDGSVDLEELQLAFIEGIQMAELLERFGTLYTADEGGEVRLPPSDSFAVVSARHGELFGMLQLSAEDEPFVLQLLPQEHVRVRVVDGAGEPQVGVPVVLRILNPGWNNDMLAIETRGPDGIAEFQNIDQLLAQMGSGGDLVLALGVLLSEPVQAPLDPEALPVEPVQLVLPPTGEVEVRVVDAGGEPVADEVYFAGLSAAPEVEDPDTPSSLPTGRPVRLENGRALFPYVGLGLRLEAVAGSMDSGTPAKAIGYGPTAAGERVVMELVDDVVDPVVVGRLLDEQGEPIADERVGFDFTQSSENSSSSWGRTLQTDGEGRFEVTLGLDEDDRHYDERSLEFEYEPSGSNRRYEAEIDLSGPLRPGVTDVGDVFLVLPPLLVSGVVVDELGEPLKGVDVSLEGLVYYGEEDEPNPEEYSYWQGLWELDASSDREGAFELRGSSEHPKLRLTCNSSGYYLEQPVEFPAGATGLRVVLRGAGGISGSVLVDEGVPLNAIRLERSTGDEDDSEATWPDEDGEFSWDPVPPGTYDVAVVLDGEQEPIHLVEGVRVAAGETAEDPRLQGIDLTGRLVWARLKVVDPDGERVEYAEATLVSESSDHPVSVSSWGDDIEFVRSRPPLDLRVSSPGYRDALLEDVQGEQEVVLKSGIPVCFVLNSAVDLPEDCYLQVTLQPIDGQHGGGFHHGAPEFQFDANGEARGSAGRAASYRVQLWAWRVEGNSSTGTGLGDNDLEIEVLDLDAEQVFQLDVSQEAVDEALG